MNDEGISDGETPNRAKAVIAVVFSALLVGSVFAPAYGMQAASASGPSVEAADAAQSVQSIHADGHPATLPGADVESLPTEGSPSSAENDSALPENATMKRVTLVTGHTVTVVETENRTRYRVDGGERVRKVSTGNATYVFPVGVDFSKFDRHLFDVDFLVDQNLTDAESDSIPVIVSEDDRQHFVATADRSPGGTLDAVAGAERRATLESIDAEAGTLDKGRTARAYADLAADDAVERVTLDVKYRLDLDDAESAVSAPTARKTHGVSGNDVKIAVLDSGIDENHSAIDRVVAEKDFTGEGHTDDLAGHGTHVAGIIASDDETYTGIAPNASLMDVRVLGENNWGYTSWIIDGMEYADANGADVVSMSIGGPVYYERSNDRYTDAVNEIVANGTLVVTSAGNAGPGYGTVNTPGVQSKALTVGATNASSGDVAWFSSRGPTPHGYYLKPNLVAPGVGVMSAEAGTDGFTAMSGTSMATPAVSGVAALLLERRPDLSPREVRGILTTTSDPLGNRDVYEQGAGEVNATDAVGTDLLVSPGTVDFGTFGTNTTDSRVVTVRNLGDSDAELDASASAQSLGGDDAHVTVNDSKVTVPAGGSADVELTVHTDTSFGVYSGRLSFGEEYSVAFGFVRAHEVTVEKTGIDGTPADGDPVWLFADRAGPFKTAGYEGYDQLNDSSVTFHVVEGGEYHVLSDGFDEDTGQPIILSENLTVDDDRTVSLDESETVPYELDVSELEANHETLSTRSVEVNYFQETDGGMRYFGSLTGAFADGMTVRFSDESNLAATVERLLVPETAGDSDNFSAEAVYHLLHEVDGVSGNRTTRVAPSDLAVKNTTYRRTTPDESYDISMVATSYHPADLYYSHTVTDGIADRRHQTVYLNEGVDLHGVGATAKAGATAEWNLSASYTTRHEPGKRYAKDVNEHPYTADVFWDVFDGELVYYGAAQIGQGGHVFEDDAENSIRVSRNGTEEFRETFSNGTTMNYTDLAVRPNTDLEFTMTGNNDATSLSTRTVTTYRGTYAPGEDYAPPEIRGVEVRNLSTNNTGGGNVRIAFTTDADATEATVKLGADASTVPFDGNTDGWKSASVERVFTSGSLAVYEATFDVGEQFGERVGPMDFAVRTVDENGNEVEITTFDAFRVDADKPTVEFAAMGATDAPTTVPDGPIHTNDSLTTDVTVNGTPGNAESVRAVLSADFANFRTETRAEPTGGKNWTFAENLSEYPDDGNYTVEVVGVDRHGNVERTEAGPTVVLDRDAPDLGATVTETAGNDARVTITSDEPLESALDATVKTPAGNDASLSLARNDSADGYVWEDTFALDGDGTYDVTASAADRAGNLGRANSTAEIESVDTKDGKNVTVVLEESGMFIEFWTNDTNVQSTVTVTESRSALAPLTRNLAGLNFLNGELGKELTDNLDEATIGIPVDESELPPGIARKDVTISYYDKRNGNWEPEETSVRNVTVNGTEGTYWVTNVTHFSTYGAVAEDDDAPTVHAKSPTKTFDYGTSQATVEFEYGDNISGINASAVELYFDGERVTDAGAANVTGAYATYDATELDGGDYTARVRVVDEAGNAANYTTSFAVQADDEPPTVLDVSPAGGTEFESGTESATLHAEFADDVSGVDADAVEVWFDGANVTADATVTNDSVTYVADSLSDGSSYTFELHLCDRDDNRALYTYAFNVAEPSSGGGGGGGGGGNVPPPAVQVETTALSSTHVEAKVVSARADSPGRVSLPGGLRGADATFRTVTVVPKSEEPEPRFLLDAVASETAPDGVAAFDAAGEPLGFLTVTPTYVTDGELDSVGVAFDVGTATAQAPENVALYRHADDDWERLDTEFVGERGDSYRFRASADATGTYAVALAESTFEVRDASLDASTIPVGGTAKVFATIENVGTETGTHDVELTADGEVVETTEVSLAAGERTTVHFDRTFETGGEYDVAVGGADAGTLVVSTDATTQESGASEADDADEAAEGGDDGVSGFGVLVAVVALLAATLVARRRTE